MTAPRTSAEHEPERQPAVPLDEFRRTFGRRVDLSPEERREVLSQLFHDGDRRLPYLLRFFTLLSLSVAIAALGMLADSPAIVIGAMLVAPMMTPIQAAAASVVMGWQRRQLQSLALVALASGWAIALSFAFGFITPDRVNLPSEVLARTEPTLFDLGVALAAGAAGAYTLVRRESSALPGVAVAVALVTPLTVVGITLENGRGDLAIEALLLFATNLVAIILSASLVLLAMGFTPRSLALRRRAMIGRGIFASAVGVALVAVPLAMHSHRIVTDARDRHAVEQAIREWIGDDEQYDVLTVDIDGRRVTVDVIGPDEPPAVGALDQMIAARLGQDATIHVRWLQRNEIRVR